MTTSSSPALVPTVPLTISLRPIPGPGAHVGRFSTVAEGEEGVFRLSPVDTLNAGHLVKIGFQPAPPAGVTWDQLVKQPASSPGPDYARQAQIGMGTNELGYVTELQLALGVISAFRGRPLPEASADELLAEAGFEYRHSVSRGDVQTRVFHKNWKKRGFFCVFISDRDVHLMFEKNKSAHGHHNLAYFKWLEAWGEDLNKPIFWPASYATPSQVALRAVLMVMDAWDPAQVYSRR